MTSSKPETATPTKTGPATGPTSQSADVQKRRPRKSDAGHTLTTLTTWVNRTGRPMGRCDCQCQKWLEIYGDAERVESSHARHAAKSVGAPESQPA
jgi:hypothetical protein